MTQPDETSSALTESLRAELSDLNSDVSRMAGDLTEGLAKALVQGKELDGLLQRLVLREADRALTKAMNPAYDLLGGLAENVVGAAMGGLTTSAATIFNINVATPDAASFRGSETQLTASLSRAVARGQRGL